MSHGHVDIVLVTRCERGLDCRGTETGCREMECAGPQRRELTHAQFLRDYGRCPDQCRPAVQLDLSGMT